MNRFVLSLLCVGVLPAFASAHDPYGIGYEGVDVAQRSVEALALESRLYRRFEGPAQQRRIRSEIDYSEARINLLRHRLDDYDTVNRFGTGNALSVSADRTRLALRREQMIRRDLQDQLILEQRLRRRGRLVNAYAVERANVARTRAAAVGDGSITIVNH